jgi:MerR family transcriptional regulator, heat shock protein HspR
MRDRSKFGWSIAEVSRRTGIPPTTLRFYEKELPGLLPIHKTRGGHRRYSPSDVDRLDMVRRLTAQEGVTLAQVRAILTSRGDYEPLREEIERLSEGLGRQSDALEDLSRRVRRLEERVEIRSSSRPRRRGWFRRDDS